jgi:hypothetical protein
MQIHSFLQSHIHHYQLAPSKARFTAISEAIFTSISEARYTANSLLPAKPD